MAEIIRYTLLLGIGLFYLLNWTGGSPPPGVEDPDNDLIPLMVRRNDFFYKAAKSVPMIGRRDGGGGEIVDDNSPWPPRVARRFFYHHNNDDFFLKAAKSVPRIGRRDHLATVEKEATVAWPWYRDHDFIPRVMKRDQEENGPISSPVALSKEQEEPRFQP